jgi:hypothetical protein
VYERALAAKISIAPGPIFSAKQKFQNCIRLNCGNPWSEAMEAAVRELGDIIRATETTVNGAPKPQNSTSKLQGGSKNQTLNRLRVQRNHDPHAGQTLVGNSKTAMSHAMPSST